MSDFMSSDYILKTQMVTPVCPNNPIGEVGTEYGKEERIVTPEDDKGKGMTKKDAAKTDYNPSKVKPDASKNTSFLSGDIFGQGTGQGTTQSTGQGSSQATGQGSSQATGQSTQGSSQGAQSNDVKNTYLLNAPTTTVKPDKPADRGSCPPCPACQRCPEPVVECKRVVNYNAAGMSNLPVPMIADFSKF
jgi:hypothetical protein